MVQLTSQSIGPLGVFLIGLAAFLIIILLFAFTLGPTGNENLLRKPERFRQPAEEESGSTQNMP
jgi:hypothetical protein